MAAFLFCASHWTLMNSMCVCAASRRRRQRRVSETYENTFVEIIWWRVENRRDGREPRRRSSFPDNWRFQRDSRSVEEEVLRLENLGYFRRERETAASSEGFSETDGEGFVLSSSSLCLFLDPCEIRVSLSSRFDEPLAIVSVRTCVEWQLNDPNVLLVTINE